MSERDYIDAALRNHRAQTVNEDPASTETETSLEDAYDEERGLFRKLLNAAAPGPSLVFDGGFRSDVADHMGRIGSNIRDNPEDMIPVVALWKRFGL